MGIETVRPDSTIQVGTWVLTPSSGLQLHEILADDTTATFITQSVRAVTSSNIARFTLGDLSAVPDGAKIKSVAVRITVPHAEPVSGSNLDWTTQYYLKFVEAITVDAVTGQYTKLIEDIFTLFSPPKPPSAPPGTTWENVTWFTVTKTPSGGEWTVDAFNATTGWLGRSKGSDPGKIAELMLDVEYNERPVAVFTSPGEGEVVTSSTRIAPTWDYSDVEDDRQLAFDVRVFTADQTAEGDFSVESTVPILRTGTVANPWQTGEDGAWIFPADLQNGDYRVYLRVKQVWDGPTEHTSEWVFVNWTQNVPGPPAPVLTADYDPIENKVTLDVVKGGPTPSTETYNLYYSDDDGLSWAYVRGGFQVPATGGTGAAMVEDFTAPLGRIRKYKAVAYRTLGSVRVASDPSAVQTALPRSVDFWWKDLAAPSNNFAVPIRSDKPKQSRVQGRFVPLVAEGYTAYFIVINGPVGGREGKLELVFEGPDATSGFDAFNRIYTPGRELLFQYPNGEQFFVMLGDVVEQPDWAPRDEDVYYRFLTVDYYQIQEPPDPGVPTT